MDDIRLTIENGHATDQTDNDQVRQTLKIADSKKGKLMTTTMMILMMRTVMIMMMMIIMMMTLNSSQDLKGHRLVRERRNHYTRK